MHWGINGAPDQSRTGIVNLEGLQLTISRLEHIPNDDVWQKAIRKRWGRKKMRVRAIRLDYHTVYFPPEWGSQVHVHDHARQQFSAIVKSILCLQ